MVDFSTLKKNRQKNFEELTKKLASGGKQNTQKDERYWTVTRDAAGNGSAIIRFLPAPVDNEEPYVTVYDHGFQDPTTGKYYIEKSLSTIGQDDPLFKLNSRLYKEGDAGKKQAGRQKRRTSYHGNILVVKDPAAPENDGKVFLFKFGKKILEKITDVMQQTDELDDDPKFNPFDLWDGANFRLRVTVVEEYPNYDKSKFEAPSPVADDDDEIEAIWKKEHDLKFLTDPANFKTYEELQSRLNDVLGVNDEPAPSSRREETTARKPQTIADTVDDEPIKKAAPKEDEDSEDLEAWLANLGKGDE